MITARDPLSGPFKTSHQITDYRDQPGYPIRLPDVPPGSDAVAGALSRLGRFTRDEKAA